MYQVIIIIIIIIIIISLLGTSSIYIYSKVFLLFTDIHVKEVRPPDFNKDKKYAVLFSV